MADTESTLPGPPGPNWSACSNRRHGYTDQRGPGPEGVATQLARQLAALKPADSRTIGQPGRSRWADWGKVISVCRSLAVEMAQ